MSLKIDIAHETLKPKITIFGVGGAGGNAINNMIRSNLEGVEFVAANTDAQALQNSLAQNRIQLGLKVTRGLGAGSFPDRGRLAAEENVEEIERYLEGNNMVFIAAGMGGGTGTGAAPVIAKLARERDILTVGVVTKPFQFEGKYRMETAESGIEELKKHVDTLIIIPNQNLFRIANEQTTFESAFKMADDVLHAGVRGVTDLITMPGLVNLDFADIRTIMTKMGKAMMGTGEASGENRAIEACEAAISNPLLDDISIKGAKGVLVNMTGGPDMTLFEADMAVNAIRKEVDQNANIIFGSAFNENMKGKIRISVVATGIESDMKRETVKSEVRQSFEPSRFKVKFDDIENPKAVKESTKSFFNPGQISTVDEEVEEISDVGFKSKKIYLKEPNAGYGDDEGDHETNEKKSPQANFFEEKDIDEDGSEVIEKKVEYKKSITKSVKAPSKPKKKESSGFSLFSFMNSSKSRDLEEDDLALNYEEELEEEDREEEIVERVIKKSPPKKSLIQELPADGIRAKNAEKKRKEFFGGTVFDEEENDKDEERVEDDILNVPAFFRRKK